MLYLNEKDLTKIGQNWNATIDNIELAVQCLDKKDYVQPVKPYLRYRDLTNRIIALIAFVGGKINLAGIKWIASFPDNINHGLPRAHSVVILNDADTGAPVGIINTALLSQAQKQYGRLHHGLGPDRPEPLQDGHRHPEGQDCEDLPL